MGKRDAFEELVQAAMKQLEASRKPAVSAVKNVADDAGKLASSAALAVKKALKQNKPKTPKVTSTTAKTVTPKPSRTLTKDEQRKINQQLDKERLDAQSLKNAEKKAAKKKLNREKYLNKEKQRVDEKWTSKNQRELGRPIINKALEKKLNAIDYKLRIIKNESGEFDRVVEKTFRERLASIKADGYKLDNAETKEMLASIQREIKERAERNVDTMSANVKTKMEKYSKMTPAEMDTEAGRQASRAQVNRVKTGSEPKDTRKDFEVRQDKETTMRLEALERKKADAARGRVTTNRGSRPPRPPKPFEESESGKRLQAAQKANAAKNAERKSLGSGSARKFTAEELRQTKIISEAEAQAKKAAASKGGEGYNVKPSVPLPERNAMGMTREEFAAFKAKQAKGAKAPKKK